MKINGQETNAKFFAYEGCHKIYLIEDEQDMQEVNATDGYEAVSIDKLPHAWDISCELRFISNWKLTKRFVEQFEQATFEL